MAANSLVSRLFDDCNLLFRNLSILNIRKLDSVQNSLDMIITNTTLYSHIAPAPKNLHWLPVEQCSLFNIFTIVYKFTPTWPSKIFQCFCEA